MVDGIGLEELSRAFYRLEARIDRGEFVADAVFQANLRTVAAELRALTEKVEDVESTIRFLTGALITAFIGLLVTAATIALGMG